MKRCLEPVLGLRGNPATWGIAWCLLPLQGDGLLPAGGNISFKLGDQVAQLFGLPITLLIPHTPAVRLPWWGAGIPHFAWGN